MTSQSPFLALCLGKNKGDSSVAFGSTILFLMLSNHDIECINMDKRSTVNFSGT